MEIINKAQAEKLNTDHSPTKAATPDVPSYFFSGLCKNVEKENVDTINMTHIPSKVHW